jgi:hypothetical protein
MYRILLLVTLDNPTVILIAPAVTVEAEPATVTTICASEMKVMPVAFTPANVTEPLEGFVLMPVKPLPLIVTVPPPAGTGFVAVDPGLKPAVPEVIVGVT